MNKTPEQIKQELAGLGIPQALEIAQGPGKSWNEATIRDIVGKMAYYPMTAKQENFLKTLVAKVSGPVVKVPEGRVHVKGTVVSAEWRESRFGSVRKMLVRSPLGWSVWATVPSAWSMGVKGSAVEFVATVKASSDDPAFGFASRPSPISAVAPGASYNPYVVPVTDQNVIAAQLEFLGGSLPPVQEAA